MVPIVMVLVGGRFTGTDQFDTAVSDATVSDAAVSDAAAHEVSGRLGSLGTFGITVRGPDFALVGRGSIGGTEAGFPQGQVQHLQGFTARFPWAVTHNPDPPRLEVWRAALAAAGAAVRQPIAASQKSISWRRTSATSSA